ncbi:MAG TPA: sporulation transcription factor Spo0A [Limnochordales bacterium]|nr:sporulation transcription factor Spo0A [Limnochordales bacterium]
MIKVLIADNNLALCASLSQFLNGLPDMEVVGCAYDGEETLELIAKTKPDVVILDITMPRLDGMAVLERLDDLKLERRPRIIVLTALAREDIAKRFTELGADYFLLKPFDLQLLAERIRQFATAQPPEAPAAPAAARPAVSKTAQLEAMVTRLLHQMGMPAHFKGYQYLRDAVLMAVEGSDVVGGSLSKEVYPRLASKYNATPGGVEAAIRNALIACWENGNRAFLEQLTGQSHRTKQGRFPTNSMVIAQLADQLRMQVRAS